jgi:hypothetical protein
MPGTATPQLYLVQSKISDSDWVLTITHDGGAIVDWAHDDCAVHLGHNTYSDAQLWMREDDARGGFFLRAPTIESTAYPGGIVLRAGGSQGGGVALIKPKDLSDAEQIWRKEDGDWCCLNKLADWEQKLQVLGDGPYNEGAWLGNYEYDGGSDHELWKLVPYTPDYATATITYGAVTLSKGDPITATSQTFANHSATVASDFTASLSASQSTTHTHSVSNSSSKTLTLTQSIGAKFAIDKVFEVSETSTASASRTTAITIGDQDSVSESVTATSSVKVTVPAGKRYEVALMANRCTVTAPYTAVLARKKPDGTAATSYTITGSYVYDGAYRYEVAVYELNADGTRRADVTDAATPATPAVALS